MTGRLWTGRALGVLATLAITAQTVRGEEPAEAPPQKITIAVLGFEAVGNEGNTLGEGINEVIAAMISATDRFAVVDRAAMNQTLAEQGVNLSGVTDTSAAISVGKVVGAKLLVTGKAFELGQSRVVTAKVIGTETTLVRSVMVKGELDVPLDTLVLEAGEKIVAEIEARGAELIASEAAADPVPGLIEQLKERELPVFVVVIPEEHRVRLTPVIPPDPAVETELKKLLLEAGASVQDVRDNALADWVKSYEQGENPAWPRTLDGVRYVIVGEAFSESAGALGNLRLASARCEINVIDRRDGRIVHADRATTRGVDLADEIAGKTALEAAGRVTGERLLRWLIEQ